MFLSCVSILLHAQITRERQSSLPESARTSRSYSAPQPLMPSLVPAQPEPSHLGSGLRSSGAGRFPRLPPAGYPPPWTPPSSLASLPFLGIGPQQVWVTELLPTRPRAQPHPKHHPNTIQHKSQALPNQSLGPPAAAGVRPRPGPPRPVRGTFPRQLRQIADLGDWGGG